MPHPPARPAVTRHLAAVAAELDGRGIASRITRPAGTPVLTTGPPAGPGRRHGRHRPRHARRPRPAPGLHLRLDPGPGHHPPGHRRRHHRRPERRQHRPPAPAPPAAAADAARLAGFLRRHPGWSAFWDPRYGLWRAAEDDPGSVLYAETPDADAVISYITGCSRTRPPAPG